MKAIGRLPCRLPGVRLVLQGLVAGFASGCAAVPPLPQGYVNSFPQTAGKVDGVVHGGIQGMFRRSGEASEGPSGGVDLDPYLSERVSLPITAWGGVLDNELTFAAARMGVRYRLKRPYRHVGVFIGGAVGASYLRLASRGSERHTDDPWELQLDPGEQTFGWSAELQAGVTIRGGVIGFSASCRPTITDSGATLLTGWSAGNATLVIFLYEGFGITATVDLGLGLSFPESPNGGLLVKSSASGAFLLGLTWSGPPPDDPGQ